MSNFTKKIRIPATNKIVTAGFIDNYFGHREYAILIRKDNKDFDLNTDEKDCNVYSEDELDLKYMQDVAMRDSEAILGDDMSEEEQEYYRKKLTEGEKGGD